MFVGTKISEIEKAVAKLEQDVKILQRLISDIPKDAIGKDEIVTKDYVAKIEKKRFAIRLRLLRKDAGMTQRELAEKIGCDMTIITRYETARIMPRKKAIEKLALALNVSVDALDIRKAYTK